MPIITRKIELKIVKDGLTDEKYKLTDENMTNNGNIFTR